MRLEQEAEAVERYRTITEVMARQAHELVVAPRGGAEQAAWPGSERELALAVLTVALHESGFRRDVQFGEGPLGRGPEGESCLLQLQVDQAPRFAPWVSEQASEMMKHNGKAREEFAQTLLGDEPAALARCIQIGMRMLCRARRACGARGRDWAKGMFSMYGSGASCNVPSLDNRARTFKAMQARLWRFEATKK